MTEPRTLYVSDLDGTLLLPDLTLGARTIEVVNQFVAAGGLFSYATARSFTSALKVTGGLALTLPVITYGGAVIVDPRRGEPRPPTYLPVDVVAAVQRLTADSPDVQPIMYAMHAGRDRVCWLADRSTPFVREFLAARQDDPRLWTLDSWDGIAADAVFYMSIIGDSGPMLALRDALGDVLDSCHVVFGEVYGPGDYWMELGSVAGTKATAVERLRAETGAARVVCFGDSLNDLSMFATADVAIAVGNAVPEVRAAAAQVIGSNADQSVAHWLTANGSR